MIIALSMLTIIQETNAQMTSTPSPTNTIESSFLTYENAATGIKIEYP